LNLCLCVTIVGALATANATVRVASLANHDGGAWDSASQCSSAACNLAVYEAAAIAAKALGAELLLFPEAYGLTDISDEFEPFASPVGSALPCEANASAVAPQQHALACFAQRHQLTIAASVFAKLPNGTKRIMEMVYHANGTVLAAYSKYVLVPVFETRYAKPGPFAPTSFEFRGMRWGIIICYEGVYADLPWGNWNEIDALKAQGADALLWSIGGIVPPAIGSEVIARHAQIGVIVSETEHASTFTAADGTRLPTLASPPLSVPGYTANATVIVGEVSAALPA